MNTVVQKSSDVPSIEVLYKSSRLYYQLIEKQIKVAKTSIPMCCLSLNKLLTGSLRWSNQRASTACPSIFGGSAEESCKCVKPDTHCLGSFTLRVYYTCNFAANLLGKDFLVRFKCMRPRKNGEASSCLTILLKSTPSLFGAVALPNVALTSL